MDETHPDAASLPDDSTPIPTTNPEPNPKQDDPNPPEIASFADELYAAVNDVIGGDNPQQFFCMGLPGTALEQHQYTYDVEHNELKPPLVEANESKLVNKLFDACRMTASDNGRQLQTQFKTALDIS